MNEKSGKLTFAERLSYGIGELPGAANAIVAAFLTMFYTDNMGMAAGAIGTMFFISRVFDGVSDVIAGNIIDKTKTKWGKARPWLLWLCVPIGISIALLVFVPKGASETAKMVYAFLTYNLFTTVLYTMVCVAKSALMALMTQDNVERSKLAKYSVLFGLGGSLIGCSVTFPLISMLGGDTRAWRIVFCLYGVITAVGVLLSFVMSNEHVQSVENAQHQDAGHKISLKEGLKNFVKNKYFIFALCTNFLTNFSNNLNSGSQTYFYKYAMNNEMLTASLNIYTLVPTVISLLFLAEPCVRKFGKKKSVYIGAGGHVIGYSLRGVAAVTGNLGLLIFGTVLCGIFTGPLAVPNNTLSADAVDYGEYLTNTRIEGMGSAVLSCANKISSGLAAGVVGWVLGLTGFIANTTQSAVTTTAITVLFAWGPAVLLIITMLAFHFVYHYDKEQPEVIAELERRKREQK